MKKITFIILFLAFTLSAQNVYFCPSYTEDGNPIDATNELKIKPGGSTFTILLNMNGTAIHDEMIYLFVDRKEGGEYQPFDSRPIDIREGRTWVAYDYKFSGEGAYKVNFVNSQNRLLATGEVVVLIEKEYYKTNDSFSSNYYDYSKVVFSKAIIDGKPFKEVESVKLTDEGSMFFIYLNNDSPINTGVLSIKVLRDAEGDRDFEKVVDEKKYKVDPEWKDTYFRYTVYDPGIYKFEIYNENEKLMDFGYISAYK